jgi:hypothetical protein
MDVRSNFGVLSVFAINLLSVDLSAQLLDFTYNNSACGASIAGVVIRVKQHSQLDYVS